MKVLVINGSPKLEKSNSLRLTNAFVKGLQSETEAEIEQLDIYKLNIEPCQGCLSCWKRTPGKCFKNDDMAGCIEKLIAADVIIWSFPLYYYSLPGRMKNFIDRQVPTMKPVMKDRYDGKGNGKHSSRYDLSHQRHVYISTCGFFSDKGNYDAVRAQMDLIHGVGNYTTLFCGEGEMFPVPILKDRIAEYLSYVSQAGVDYVRYGTILPATREKLDELIMPKAEFEKMGDSYYAHCEAKAAKLAKEKAEAAEAK